MALTDRDDPEENIRDFFQQQLLPLRNELQGAGKSFFATQADPGRQTYFVPREKTSPDPGDMELPRCASAADLEKKLAEMWDSQGNGELVALVPALGKLAEMLSLSEEPGEEVSPFIYVMF